MTRTLVILNTNLLIVSGACLTVLSRVNDFTIKKDNDYTLTYDFFHNQISITFSTFCKHPFQKRIPI